MTAQDVIREIGEQLEKARDKHAPPMHGPHEGYALILEELDDLWELVSAQKHDPIEMKKEALHVAAMAARFVLDLCQAAPDRSDGKLISDATCQPMLWKCLCGATGNFPMSDDDLKIHSAPRGHLLGMVEKE